MAEEKIASIAGTTSGVASVLGSWQICHSVCLGLVSVLALVGITITGMPLLFLTKIAIPMWSAAVLLLGVTIWMHLKRHCISRNWLLLNGGLIVAGTPFAPLQAYSLYLWVVGGVIAVVGLLLLLREKYAHQYVFLSSAEFVPVSIYSVFFAAIIILILTQTIGQQTGETATTLAPSITSGIKTQGAVAPSQFQVITTGSTEQGDVEIQLEPREHTAGRLVVSLAANTHSVNLNALDLKKLASLQYGSKTIKPSAATALNGHHVSGELRFEDAAITGDKRFSIIIRDIPQQAERTFQWETQ